MNLIRFLVSLSVVLASACSTPEVKAPADSCIRTRAAFDVGSGSTKMKVARVNSCEQKVLEYLADTAKPVGYREDLARGDGRQFSEAVQRAGMQAIGELKGEAVKLGATEFAGVATAAFRIAGNAQRYLNRVATETGVKVQVISQEQEALLGYAAAASRASATPEQIAVWDIGSGSMQITARDESGKFAIYEGLIASTPFKNKVIQDVKKQSLKKVRTPNPLDASQLKQARKLAVHLVKQEKMPELVKDKLRDPAVQVLGIGGVHYYSLRPHFGDSPSYSLEDLNALIEKRTGYTDERINAGKHSDTEVTNVLLVAGFMEALGVQRVTPLNVTMSDGVLIRPDFWESSDQKR